jgi:predicted RNA-binding Zn-ribbon protein involved in translation (DUF1610 family)
MPFRKTSNDGEVFVDHRASPGIPAELARRLGYAPEQVKEGAVFEAPTLGCPHCGANVVMNPLRTRERAHCYQCNSYICDWCDAARHEPDYAHVTIQQIKELVASGKYLLSGSMHRPILTKIGDNPDG